LTPNLFHIFTGGDFEFFNAIIGVAAVFWFFRFQLQGFDNTRIGHFVRLAHSHIEQYFSRIGSLCRAFGPFYFFKFVNFGVFAKLPTS
jgi:hypothetical protein